MKRSALFLLNEIAPGTIVHRRTAEVIIEEGALITQEMIEAIEKENVEDFLMPEQSIFMTH